MESESESNPFYELRNLYLRDIAGAGLRVATEPSLLDCRNSIGETILHWLSVENEIAAVDSLIKGGAKVDTTNNFGQTPLMEAASLGNLEMCALLLQHGADPRYVSRSGDSPLSFAASRCKTPAALKLLLLHFGPAEDINPYFNFVCRLVIFGNDNAIRKLLIRRGLQPPNLE